MHNCPPHLLKCCLYCLSYKGGGSLFQQDLTELKGEVNQLKNYVNELKCEVSELKDEVKERTEELKKLRYIAVDIWELLSEQQTPIQHPALTSAQLW